MEINVKLFSVLRKERFKEKVLEFQSGIIVNDIFEFLSISSELTCLVIVNELHANKKTVLNDGDTLAILPIVSGG